MSNYNVWFQSKICGTFTERVGDHPCKMPLPVMERIVAGATNPGEIVVDNFSSTGTTCLAAALLNRKYIGIERSQKFVALSNKRIGEMLEAKRTAKELAAANC